MGGQTQRIGQRADTVGIGPLVCNTGEGWRWFCLTGHRDYTCSTGTLAADPAVTGLGAPTGEVPWVDTPKSG